MIAETQESVAAALVADAGVVAIAAATPDGPAVFAPNQTFADRYPRITLDAPQRVGRAHGCSPGASDVFVTLHSWARGPAATLQAGRLADAAIAALSQDLVIAGHRVSSWAFESTRSAGDPEPDVEHLVSTLRYSVQPTG
jgi:hypothetical protein